jgi:hypothetical protein
LHALLENLAVRKSPLRLDHPRDGGVPLRWYFSGVGGALLALLFATEAFLPQPPAENSLASGVKLPMIRIYSDRKGPGAVVLDTNQPTIAPAAAGRAEAGAANGAPLESLARESFAEFVPDQPKHVAKSDPKQERAKPSLKRKLARMPIKRPRLFAQVPHFGFFGTTW